MALPSGHRVLRACHKNTPTPSAHPCAQPCRCSLPPGPSFPVSPMPLATSCVPGNASCCPAHADQLWLGQTRGHPATQWAAAMPYSKGVTLALGRALFQSFLPRVLSLRPSTMVFYSYSFAQAQYSLRYIFSACTTVWSPAPSWTWTDTRGRGGFTDKAEGAHAQRPSEHRCLPINSWSEISFCSLFLICKYVLYTTTCIRYFDQGQSVHI